MRRALRLAVGLAILAVLIYAAGPASVWRGVTAVGWKAFLLAAGLYLAGQALCGARWYLTARSIGISQPFWKYPSLYLSGMFLNLFLPTAVGGDIGRAYLLGGKEEWKKGVVSVLAERYSGFFVLSLVLALGLMMNGKFLPGRAGSLLRYLPLAVVGFPPLFLFGAGILRRRSREKEAEILVHATAWLKDGKAVVQAISLSALFHAIYIFMHLILGRSLRIDLSPWDYAVIVTLTSIVAMLPVSLGGVGIREGSYQFLLSLCGVERHTGLAFGVAVLGVNLFLSLLGGGILYLLSARFRPTKFPA